MKPAAKFQSLPSVDGTLKCSTIIQQEMSGVLLPAATEAAAEKSLPTAYESPSQVLLHS